MTVADAADPARFLSATNSEGVVPYNPPGSPRADGIQIWPVQGFAQGISLSCESRTQSLPRARLRKALDRT